jgi:hypothetical protein
MLYEEFLNREPIPEIKAVRPHAKDSIIMCDAGGLVDKLKKLNVGEGFYKKLQEGDLSLVERADSFMSQIENEQFVSKAWDVRSDVVGSMPDIPAMIAGQPMCMRRRVRTKKPQGPLAVFLETTGSSSVMGEEVQADRGAALLALVRLLQPQRAIDLYICTTYGTHNTMNAVICRVETQPMDLARACAMFHLSRMSSIGYTIIKHTREDGNPGSWSYGAVDMERRYCGEIFKRFLTPDSDLLYVPAAFGGDGSVRAGMVWLKNMLKKYGGESVVRDDDEAVVADTGHVEF